MSTPGFGLSGNPQPSIANAVEQKLRAERVVKAGANWLITVAVLSLINSVLAMSGSGFTLFSASASLSLLTRSRTKPARAGLRSI
jgi:hypothetical protein